MRDLKPRILYCLEKYPDSRNSDVKLTNAIWVEYYSHKMFRNELNQWCVVISNLYEMPRQDDVRRLRAKIQNEEGKFLPTSPEVIKQRKINEEKYRSMLGYNPELRTA